MICTAKSKKKSCIILLNLLPRAESLKTVSSSFNEEAKTPSSHIIKIQLEPYLAALKQLLV